MVDVFSKKKRSEIMSQVKSHGNAATELRMIKILRDNKITGWRRHSSIFGKPDFVFKEIRLAVFVDGCFWHGCPYHGSLPASNQIFWFNKINRNKTRDHLVNRTLKIKGWKVLRIWQHDLNKTLKIANQIKKFIKTETIR